MKPHVIDANELAEYTVEHIYASASTTRGVRKRLVIVVQADSVRYRVFAEDEQKGEFVWPGPAVQLYNDLG